jgi:hypothetical protein
VSGDVVVASFSTYKAGCNAGAGLEFRLGDSHLKAFAEARVMKFVWTNLVKNRMNGGARSFED